MAQAGYTPISLYYSTTAAAVPLAANLAAGELAINIVDGKLYYENNSGVVTLLASAAGSLGDVVGPASATDNALARFDLTTGKLIQNSVGILSDAGILTGLTGITSSGSITFSSLTSGRVPYATTAGLLTDSANLLYSGTDLTVYGITVGRGGGAVSVNTALGSNALAANTGSFNVAIGANAAKNATAFANATVVGMNALDTGVATGTYITAVGTSAMQKLTGGSYVTGIGVLALKENTSGSYNTALGVEALQGNTTASNNTAVGYQAGYSNSTGQFNTYVGGRGPGYNATGDQNTFLGDYAGREVTTGSYNTLIGQGAGYLITTGAKNTVLGLYGGNQGGLDIRTASNYIVLSDGDGNPRGIFDSDGDLIVGTTSATTTSYSKTLTAAKTHIFSSITSSSNSTAFANQRTSLFVDLLTPGSNNEYASSALLINNYSGAASNSGASIRIYHQRFGVSSETPLRVFEVNNLGNIGLGDTDASTSGTGITFPATQSASSNANTLDDYEEGTWTPVVTGTTIAGTATYSNQTGRYTKIGNRVLFNLRVSYSGGTGTGNLVVSLPFTVSSSATNAAASIYAINIALTAGYYAVATIDPNQAVSGIYSNAVGGGADLPVAYDAAGSIFITGHYEV